MAELSNGLFTFLTKRTFKDKSQIVTDVDGINRNQGTELYFIVGYLEYFLEFIGCPNLESLPGLAKHLGIFEMTQPTVSIKAVPLNPEQLPLELEDKSKRIWVLMDDFGFAECRSIEDAARSIEILMNKWPRTLIEEFAILVGNEIEFNMNKLKHSYQVVGN